MTRQEIIETYRVSPNGVILSPGKFESEMLYVPYFWNAGLNGMADEDNGQEFSFEVTPEDVAMFPELKDVARVTLYESNDGFVICSTD